MLLLFLEAGTRKAEPHLASGVGFVVLEFAHRQETLIQASELHQAHPFVLAVLLPLHLPHWAADSLAEFSDFLFLFGVHHGQEEDIGGRVEIVCFCESFALVLVFLLIF